MGRETVHIIADRNYLPGDAVYSTDFGGSSVGVALVGANKGGLVQVLVRAAHTP